jgi:hypothetical protein
MSRGAHTRARADGSIALFGGVIPRVDVLTL